MRDSRLQLAPENTLMSFEKAVKAGSGGLETDVTIRSVSDCRDVKEYRINTILCTEYRKADKLSQTEHFQWIITMIISEMCLLHIVKTSVKSGFM